MVNLIPSILLSWSGGDAQRERKKSRVASRDASCDDILAFRRSKNLCFWRNPEDVCNQLNSMSWVELIRLYARLRVRVND